jgi:hypothetical protein
MDVNPAVQMSDSQFDRLLNQINYSQSDHDLLIEIKAILNRRHDENH